MTCNAAGSVSSSPACHGPAAERARWADTYGAATSEGTDTVAVQLSFPPRQRRDENVIRTPQVLPHIVSLAEHRDLGDHLIDLDDLAVYADARHMHLIQLSTGKRVEALVPHALEGGLHTPPLARFLAEVSGARRAAYTAFDWGAAASMPFLPRLRHGRTVLCPARWLLRSADLGWFGRAHEILIPLRATGGRPSSPERRRSVGARLCVAARDAAELPGRSAWLHARIYGHPERPGSSAASPTGPPASASTVCCRTCSLPATSPRPGGTAAARPWPPPKTPSPPTPPPPSPKS